MKRIESVRYVDFWKFSQFPEAFAHSHLPSETVKRGFVIVGASSPGKTRLAIALPKRLRQRSTQ
jgi:hypothetical protein